ncbi:MAG: hypothetical protein HZC06_12745 [Methylocystis sp.]|nr:hypothetical protein [Methylocystis sp.]
MNVHLRAFGRGGAEAASRSSANRGHPDHPAECRQAMSRMRDGVKPPAQRGSAAGDPSANAVHALLTPARRNTFPAPPPIGATAGL